MAQYFISSTPSSWESAIYFSHEDLRGAVLACREKLGYDCFRGLDPQDLVFKARVAAINAIYRG